MLAAEEEGLSGMVFGCEAAIAGEDVRGGPAKPFGGGGSGGVDLGCDP